MASYVVHAGEGVVGGLLGTVFIHQALGAAGKLPQEWHPQKLEKNPREYVVNQAEKAIRRPLPLSWHNRATASASYVYGGTWGLGLGILSPLLGVRSWGGAALAGAALGATVWAAGYAGWLPVAGIAEPVHRYAATHVATTLGAHIGYGLVTSLAMYAVDRLLSPGIFGRIRRRSFRAAPRAYLTAKLFSAMPRSYGRARLLSAMPRGYLLAKILAPRRRSLLERLFSPRRRALRAIF